MHKTIELIKDGIKLLWFRHINKKSFHSLTPTMPCGSVKMLMA